MNRFRRFLLLTALAVTTLSIAAVTERPAGHAAAAETTSAALPHADAAVTVPVPSFPPRSQLEPLWSTSLSERFPRVLPLAIPRKRITDGKQIVSYYGNPFSPTMGILGEGDIETIGAKLQAQAEQYDALNGPAGVIPAVHLVYAVAQYYPGDDGHYLLYLPDEDVRRYIDYTREHNMLLFLDLQIGRSSVAAEVTRVLPYLRDPHVHLALDPEFTMSDTKVPGVDLGSMGGADVDLAQQMLERLVDESNLPPKILIVHQFADSMIYDSGAIRNYPNVERIIDMDGFGLAAIKVATYVDIGGRPYAPEMGIKLFFKHDIDLMSPETVLGLQPSPEVIIYQ